MKSKPAKYGIKIWILCDVETSYVVNLKVYTGKEGTSAEKNQGNRAVLDLIGIRPWNNNWHIFRQRPLGSGVIET